MKTKDTLTLIGSFCLAFGPQLMAQAPSPTAWWIGNALVTLGPLLIGARAFGNKDEEKPKP